MIEEFLTGEEASFFALTDGETVVAVRLGAGSQARRRRRHRPQYRRHGRLQPGPGPHAASWSSGRWTRSSARPSQALAAAGTPFSGVLYAGLMLTPEGPKLIEYNARFGDPECQVLMMRLESDLLRPDARRRAKGELAELPRPLFPDEAALTVVMAANGYPGTPKKGGAIDGTRPRPRRRRQGLPGRHRARRRHARRQRRPRAQRHRARQDRRRGAARGLSRRSTRSTSRPASAAATSAGARLHAAVRRVYDPSHVALAQAADRAPSHPARRLAEPRPARPGSGLCASAPAARRFRPQAQRGAERSGADRERAALAQGRPVRPGQRFPARRPARPAGPRRPHAPGRRDFRRGLGSARARSPRDDAALPPRRTRRGRRWSAAARRGDGDRLVAWLLGLGLGWFFRRRPPRKGFLS